MIGAINTAVTELLDEGEDDIGFTHFNYINPLPKNTADVFGAFDEILVCELNNGQFINYLKTKHPGLNYRSYKKVQGQPFFTSEIKAAIINTLSRNS